MKIFASILIATIFVPLTLKITKAQVIGKFSSQTKPDWVEIINNTDSEINFSQYLLIDVAGNKLQEDYLIPAGGNCVFDYFNRLNNSGDTIFLQKDGQQIDCVRYGDGANGQCDKTADPITEKPTPNCYKPTPIPTSTLTPDPTITPTPNTTDDVTPTLSATQAVFSEATLTPTPTRIESPTPESTIKSSPKVLAAATSSNEPIQVEDTLQEQDNSLSNILIIVGILLIVGSLASVVYNEYNNNYIDKKTFH